MAAPARPSVRPRLVRPIFALGLVSCLGFMLAGELGLLGMTIIFTALMWAAEL